MGAHSYENESMSVFGTLQQDGIMRKAEPSKVQNSKRADEDLFHTKYLMNETRKWQLQE